MTPTLGAALGVDACKAGWAAICWSDDAITGFFAPTINELVTQTRREHELAIIAIDMPIGLPDTSVRSADGLARKLIGARGSSVFNTPLRAALEAESFAEALAISRELSGVGLSKQSYALRKKAFEVDTFVRSTDLRVVEVHPEVCFMEMNDSRPLRDPKRTWAGLQTRVQLLKQAGVQIPDELGLLGSKALPDDIVDACAAAWTARRVLGGRGFCIPGTPEVFSDGLPSAIWI